jgi:periplasmic protein TonB
MNAGSLLKFVPGAAFLSAGAYAAALLVLGPYGPTRPMPPVCAEEQICVVVAGIDNDVNIGFGAEGEAFGADIDDAVATRLVLWLEQAAPAGVRVSAYKYPREIQLPEPGVADTSDRGGHALEEAHEIGERFNARLVVVGRVTGDSVSLAFIDPARQEDRVPMGDYDTGSVQWPERFSQDYGAALNAALAGRPAPTPIAMTQPNRGTRQREVLAPTQETPVAPEYTPASSATPAPAAPPYVAPTAPSSAQSVAPSSARPLPPQQPQQVAMRAPRITPPRVRVTPTAMQFQNAYPARALRRGLAGQAMLRCRVGLDGRLSRCAVIQESPLGEGFGDAARRLAENSTTAFPQLSDGSPVDGGEIQVPYLFRVADE